MLKTFELVIATPERQVYKDVVESVSLPTTEGYITVLAHHVPLVTTLKAGEVMIQKNGVSEPYAIGGGFLEVQGNQLVVLADTAEHVTEIDQQRVDEAIARAKQLQEEVREDHTEYAAVTAKLERDLARLHVIRKHAHRGHQGITHEGIRKD